MTVSHGPACRGATKHHIGGASCRPTIKRFSGSSAAMPGPAARSRPATAAREVATTRCDDLTEVGLSKTAIRRVACALLSVA